MNPISETVIVIGAGHSLAGFEIASRDLRPRGFVIGVNDAAVHTRVHTGVTMDRLWIENRIDTLRFLKIPVHYREGTCKNVKPPELGIPFKCNNRGGPMAEEPSRLDGDNSGACALNLAYKYFAKRVYLLGFDMCNGPAGQRHWFPDYPWKNGGGTSDGKLKEWSTEFGEAAKQFRERGTFVYNVSARSLLTVFPKKSFDEFLKETER